MNQYASKVRCAKDQHEWDGSYGRHKRALYDAKELLYRSNGSRVWKRINGSNEKHLIIITKILKLEMRSVGPFLYYRQA